MLRVKRLVTLLILPMILSSQVSFAQNCTLADKPRDEVCAQREQIFGAQLFLLKMLARDLIRLERAFAECYDDFTWHFFAKLAGSEIVAQVAKRVLSMNNPMLITALKAATFWVGGYWARGKEAAPEPSAKVLEEQISERERELLRLYAQSLSLRGSIFEHVPSVTAAAEVFVRDAAWQTADAIAHVGSSVAKAFVTSAPYLVLAAESLAIGALSRAVHQEITAFQRLVGQHAVPDIRPFLGLDEQACAVCFLVFGEDACFRYLGLPCRHAQVCSTCMTQMNACPVCRGPG